MPTLEEIGTGFAIFGGWLTALFGWIKWWHELRDKRKERAARLKAEAELAAARRRSVESSPYLVPSDRRFNGVTVPAKEPGQRLIIHAGCGGLLCFMRDEVQRDVTAGESIYLLVDNHGRDAYEIAIDLDGEPVGLVKAETEGGDGILAIRYPYRPEFHGRAQTIQIGFLSAGGHPDAHRYAMRHGFRTLQRIDPPPR